MGPLFWLPVGGVIIFGSLGAALLVGGRYLTTHPASRWRLFYWIIATPLMAIGAWTLTYMGVDSFQRGEVGIGVAWLVFVVFTAVRILLRGIMRLHTWLTGRER